MSNSNPKCIFCFETNEQKFNTIEHVLPESLGGFEIDILDSGYFCDSCQNYFGTKVEKEVLNNHPFILSRIIAGIPSKKKKSPRIESIEGTIHSAGYGKIYYEPNSFFEKSMKSGQKKHAIVFVKHDEKMLLRFLLKMGLQTIAHDNHNDKVYREEFDQARNFSRFGKKKDKWPLLIKEVDLKNFIPLFENGLNINPHYKLVDYSVQYFQELKDEIFYLRYYNYELITPLIVDSKTAIRLKNIRLDKNERLIAV